MSRANKSPRSGESIGSFFDVGDLAPAAVAQVSVRELVSNHVLRKLFGRVSQFAAQYHAATDRVDGGRASHEESPPRGRRIIFERNLKSWVGREIELHWPGQAVDHFSDATLEQR